VACVLALVCACGRVAFEPVDDIDAAGPTIFDFSGAVPYNPTDFIDGFDLSNEAKTVASVTAPFADGFVVGAGRNLIEIGLDQTIVVHDYRPAPNNGLGPDEIDHITFGSSQLWLSSATPNTGDGLFTVDAAWNLVRENSLNNIFAAGWDEGGLFDDRGTSALYFTQGTAGVYRRDAPAMQTRVFLPVENLGSMAINATAVFTVEGNTTRTLIRVASVTHVGTALETAVSFEVAEGGPAEGAIVIRDQRDLLLYADDGTSTLIASAPDADTRWVAATVPRAPHPLMGRIIVVEVNRVLDRDRLLVF
jgi:hypothetical protein